MATFADELRDEVRRRYAESARAVLAGERVRSGVLRTFRAVVVLAALAGVSIGAWRADLVGHGRDLLRDARVFVAPHYEQLVPTAARATSHRPGHTARKAVGNVSTSFWAEGAPGNGRGEKLVVRFGRAVDVARVGVLAGDQSKRQDFVREPVPVS